MRIVSLLPSLTELICDLGRRDDLVGVTHECDFPPGVDALPHLTRTRIPHAATGAEIDALVAAQGGSLYDLDDARLASLRPDLILTQSQCDVCAVNERTVREVAAGLPGSPRVESVNPLDLAGVFAMFRRVGELLGSREAAEGLVSRFERLAAEIARRRAGLTPPRVALLEWLDPPYRSGHWNPEIVGLAGGVEVLAKAGEPSSRVSWAEVAAAGPEVLLLAPCGFGLERGRVELAGLSRVEEWPTLPAVADGRVALIDGSSYFARPGPRLSESLGIAAAAIDAGRCGDLATGIGWEVIGVGGGSPIDRFG